MSIFSQTTKTVILGGLFTILPLLAVIVLFNKGIQLLLPVGRKLVDMLDIHTLFGKATVSIICGFILILLCYISGMLVGKGLFRRWNNAIEEKLFLFFPGFQMLKYRLAGDQTEIWPAKWRAILLKDNQFYRVAFITDDSNPEYLSLYLPDAPRMDAGEIRMARADECEYLDITMAQAMNMLTQFGRGFTTAHLPRQQLSEVRTSHSTD
jgi:uncharacterized membrane protein